MRVLAPLLFTAVLLALCFLIAWAIVVPAHAEEAVYTPEDVVLAIHQASAEIGVSEAWLRRTVDCETGGTFDPYSVGKLGELGAAQLAPWGELRTFRSWGYVDPFSPYQAIRFMAQQFSFGKAGAWSCS